MEKNSVRKAIIPVAGFGTRFLPITKSSPKEMLAVVDRPVIDYIVEEAVEAGIDQIIMVTSQNKQAIEDYFDRSFELEELLKRKGKTKELEEVVAISEKANFYYIRQPQPLGFGHAVMLAKEIVGQEACMVYGGDDIIMSEDSPTGAMINVYEKYHDPVVGVVKVGKEEVSRYGVIDPVELADRTYQAQTIIEKPKPAEAPSRLAVGGRWLLTSEVFEELGKIKPDASGEIQITEALKNIAEKQALYAYEYEGQYFDCGNKIGYLKALVNFGLIHPEVGEEFKKFLSETSGHFK